MFGHQAEPDKKSEDTNSPSAVVGGGSAYGAGAFNPALPPSDTLLGAPATSDVTPPSNDAPGSSDSDSPQADPIVAPSTDTTTQTPADSNASVTGPLGDLKQQALQQLTPLVGHLDQTPEEKFRTTMMMIQASDNQDLLPAAYEAANKITDEKARAQALLDVVNEINYFTQQQKS